MDPDRDLVEAAAGGSREAFDELVRRYQGRIVNLARAMTASDGDAEDLAQEAFVRAWRGIAGFRRESSFKTWLYGVATNVIRTERGRRSRLRQIFWAAPRSAGPDDDDPIARASVEDGVETALAMRQAIDRALSTLPGEMREVLRDVQGLDYQEISEALGIPIGTVESRIFRGRQRLRPLLEPFRATTPQVAPRTNTAGHGETGRGKTQKITDK